MSDLLMGSAVFALVVQVLALSVIAVRARLLRPRPCVVTVNGRQRLAARTHQRLLPLLGEAGIALPAACGGSGTCGLCRVRVVRGGGDPSPTEVGRLGSEAALAGVRLACQVVLRGDLALELPDELLGVQRWTCTVRSNRTLAPFIAELVLALPADAQLDFRAGAFVQVGVPAYTLDFATIQVAEPHRPTWERYGLRSLSAQATAPVSRAYSLANRPLDADALVLNVRLALPPPGSGAPPGIASSYLFAARPGTQLEVTGPFGTFAVQDSDREMVFIGGGAGMAPLRAMIFDQLERVHTTRQLSFWYGARSLGELFYADEFEALQRQHGNFRWTVALSEPGPDDPWSGPVGFIHEVVLHEYLQSHPAPEGCEYYLCGPPLMTRAVLGMLEQLGVERDHIFNDDFGG